MRSLSLALLVAAAAGCGASVTNPDAAVAVSAGCRSPAACYASTCGCTRPVNGIDLCQVPVDLGSFSGITDLAGVVIGCPTETKCVEPAQECVGRQPAACPGAGARCLPFGSVCGDPDGGGDPPDVVGVDDPDAGPSTEPHCAYVDDVCCPGAVAEPEDLGVVDANLDQSASD